MRYWLRAVPVLLTVLTISALACRAGEESAVEESDKKKRTADVVYVATPHDVVDRMLRMAQVKKEDLVYDLGCGDGRIVVNAAKRYGCKGIGFDIDDDRVAESRENVRKAGVGHLVQIKQEDIYTVDLSPATLITSYLLPEMNKKLIPQFQKMKDGTRIVAHDYQIPGATADKSISMTSNEDGVKHWIYLYTLPLKLDASAEEEEDAEDD